MNFQRLKDFLDYYLPMLGIPGSDTVIYKNHEEIFRYQSGYDSLRFGTPVRDNALYHMCSVTKISTCVAATQLIERGEILATDPIYAYFPEYKNLKVKKKLSNGETEIVDCQKPMLIKHLLTMTSGLNYDINRSSIQRVKERTGGRCPTLDIVRAFAEDPLEFEPGDAYKYGLSLDVIGGLVELVSGMKLGEYMKEYIFEPLGMYNTSFGMDEDKRNRLATQYQYDALNKRAQEIPIDRNNLVFGPEYESGGGGLISSVDDQILLADALTHGGMGKNGNRILSSAAVKLMSTNMLPSPILEQYQNDIPHVRGYGYGYGVRVNVNPESCGNMTPVGEFGWDGAKCSYFSCDPVNKIAFFHAEHMGSLHAVLNPRLRNVVYSCLDD